MKKADAILEILGLAGVAATAILAIVALGTLVIKGPAALTRLADTGAQTTNVEAPASENPVRIQTGDNKSAEIRESSAAAGTAPADQGTAPAEQATQTEASAAQTVSVDAGARVFKKCKSCHTIEKSGKNKVGPNLWSILGSNIAGREGFKYSAAMAGLSDRNWDVDVLDQYLANPKKMVKGTKMVFAGLKKQADRHNLIAYLAAQSDTPVAPAELGLVSAAAAGQPDEDQSDEASASAGAQDVAAVADTPPAGVPVDPPERTDQELAEIGKRVDALKATIGGFDYEQARYHPLHFQPQVAEASNEECLVCHQEILNHTPREVSPAGLRADAALAWYQTLDSYSGEQGTFHYRHLESQFAKQVMNLSCNFCHQGNDPREESPDMQPGKANFSAAPEPTFTLRKMVNPTQTCLRCHGAMPDPVDIMGLGGPWHEARVDLEDEETPNGCLTCHEELYRTVRHQVNYLKAASIEQAAKAGSDVCFGCHGGRQWYRIAYPYPRTPWPDMDEEIPDWAKDRPTGSDPQYRLKPNAVQ